LSTCSAASSFDWTEADPLAALDSSICTEISEQWDEGDDGSIGESFHR
jgi:hypothetical protein